MWKYCIILPSIEKILQLRDKFTLKNFYALFKFIFDSDSDFDFGFDARLTPFFIVCIFIINAMQLPLPQKVDTELSMILIVA